MWPRIIIVTAVFVIFILALRWWALVRDVDKEIKEGDKKK